MTVNIDEQNTGSLTTHIQNIDEYVSIDIFNKASKDTYSYEAYIDKSVTFETIPIFVGASGPTGATGLTGATGETGTYIPTYFGKNIISIYSIDRTKLFFQNDLFIQYEDDLIPVNYTCYSNDYTNIKKIYQQ